MAFILNDVRKGTYLDSVALMRMSRTIAARDGVEECGMMMATPANKRIMADAGVLDAQGEGAGGGDLVIAIRARDRSCAEAARRAAIELLDAPKVGGDRATAAWRPRTLRAATAADPKANVALISVPGAFAAAEARKALNRRLNVMMFSDNVPLAEEAALKRQARQAGLLLMGPDCGTAILGGVPLAFANVVPRGDIGIIGASGTGIQEVTCLIANHGGGISHAIGTGGRDLKAEIGGLTALAAIDLLDEDAATRHIVLISKPPAACVAATVLTRVGASRKTFTILFIGDMQTKLPVNATRATNLKSAAELALGRTLPGPAAVDATQRGREIRGLFCGGTLCAEAQLVLHAAGAAIASNAPVFVAADGNSAGAHRMIDLGDDEYTQGRPHPMIEPAVRSQPLAAALGDPSVGVVLIDIVLGHGGHADPAAAVVSTVAAAGKHGKALVASVCGTDGDPQGRRGQMAALRGAGFLVHEAMADAATTAAAIAGLKG